MIKQWHVFFILTFIFLSCQKESKPSYLVALDGPTMGTLYSIKIVNHDLIGTEHDSSTLHHGIDSLLRLINQQMSTYQKNSELSLFNQYRGRDWFPVSIDLCLVIKKSLQISKISGGAFDITVGPLVNLWGFGPEERVELIPTEANIQERKKLVGYDKLEVRISPPALKKKISEMYCDLAAIAKGYAVDKVGEYLENHQIKNYIVDIGGEVKVSGKNHLGASWKIGIATPDDQYGIQKVIFLKNMAVATSGDYRNYFEKDGIRYSHTIDPHSGRPITHQLASVTVIHDSCMVADGLATAINVLGPDKGYQLAQRLNLAVFMIIREENRFVERMTPPFKKFLEADHKD